MSDKQRVTTLIRLVNGEEIRLRHTRDEEASTLTSRIDQALEQKNFIIIGLPDKTLALPIASILSIETTPALPTLPPRALTDVMLA